MMRSFFEDMMQIRIKRAEELGANVRQQKLIEENKMVKIHITEGIVIDSSKGWQSIPDDPNRVGDEDYNPSSRIRYEIDDDYNDEECDKILESDEYREWRDSIENN